MKTSKTKSLPLCTPRFLPTDELPRADEIAFRLNPDNRPPDAHLGPSDGGDSERLVVERRVYWGKAGVKLTVGFLDNPRTALRKRILAHMNAWNARGANVEFVESKVDPKVRIARLDHPESMAGYWSYLGTDILTIEDPSEPTMNLEGFTMRTPDAEFRRVVRHETGHTLGFPHEHMRKALIDKLDRDKVIAYYKRTQGWSKRMVMDQVLTPLESHSILGSKADAYSIMCYDAPGEITKDGEPIPGGTDIDELDYTIVERLYPSK